MEINERIKQIIHEENEIKRFFNMEAQKVAEYFKPYLNKQATKQDTTLLKKIKEGLVLNRDFKIKPLKEGDNAIITALYIRTSPYDLMLNLKVCFSGGSYEDKTYYCEYVEGYFYFAELNKNVITKLKDYEQRTLINPQEEIKAFHNADRLKKEFEKQKENIKLMRVRQLI